MRQHVMPVWVLMRLRAVPLFVVFMLMVFVMRMTVHVFQRIMRVNVPMPLGQMKHHSESHQSI